MHNHVAFCHANISPPCNVDAWQIKKLWIFESTHLTLKPLNVHLFTSVTTTVGFAPVIARVCRDKDFTRANSLFQKDKKCERFHILSGPGFLKPPFLVTKPPQKLIETNKKKILKCGKKERKTSHLETERRPCSVNHLLFRLVNLTDISKGNKNKATIWFIVPLHGMAYSYESFCIVEKLANPHNHWCVLWTNVKTKNKKQNTKHKSSGIII